MEEDVEEHMSVSPPTKLKNPALFKPFEMFVEMYGLPAYQEMDPTIFIALTYTLMFGIMFGDVGQGLCLLIGGFVFYRIRHMNLGAILSLAGIWSTVFGFMYGSVFGFEDILKPVWMRPMDNIMTTLMLAIGFGMFLILAAMVLNIINAVRAKDVGRILFSPSGVAGILCYGCAVLCIVLYAFEKPVPATGILAVFVGVPLIAILLKEPLTNLLERKKKLFPEGESKAMFFVESLVELFDVVLSYATNSISFVRVGAFALSHAGMMGVVLTLAGYESGSPNWIVVVLGNIVVTGLEGLVVGIQVLRLDVQPFLSGNRKAVCGIFRKQEIGGEKDMAAKITLVAILIFSMVIPFLGYVLGNRKEKSFKASLAVNLVLFFGTVVVADMLLFSGHIYAASDTAASAAEGWRYMAAALSTGLSCIGAGVAVASAASAAIGALSEDSSIMGKALIFVALAESIALYGLLISFSILG